MKEARHDIPVHRSPTRSTRARRLRVGGTDYGYYRLDAVGRSDRSRDAPGDDQDPAREPAPPRGRRRSSAPRTSRRSSPGGRAPPPRRRSRSCRRGSSSRTSPACRRSSTWRSCVTRWPISAATRPGQPARPGRPRHRPLRPDRPVRDARRVRLQRGARVRPQRRALPAAALGPDRVPRPAGRAARDRDRPPGQPRVPGHGRHAIARMRDGGRVAYPDTVVGTDSHTTMVNGLGVLGYGVGGIEAEAVLLGQPLYQPMPHVVGVRLHGALPRGSTATDLVLVVTELLRGARRGRLVRRVRRRRPGHAGPRRPDDDQQHEPRVRGDLDALPDRRRDAHLPAPDRPIGRAGRARRALRPGPGAVARARRRDRSSTSCSSWTWRASTPSVAGPRRPQDRVPLEALRANFRSNFPNGLEGTITELGGEEPVPGNGMVEEASAESFPASDPPSFTAGDAEVEAAPPADPVVADAAAGGPAGLPAGRDRDRWPAASPSGPARSRSPRSRRCTNTSNPTVMVGAGLLARNAVARGLRVGPTVKTSLAPGSRAVTGYLEAAGLMAPLEALGFALAGYGCTTCIGNSGPLDDAVAAAIEANDLVVAAVLSGNRNFEGRIHPLARASYLASPPLVVAFALAGRVDIDLTDEPLGIGRRRPAGLPRRHLAGARGDPVGHRRQHRSRSSSGEPTRPSSRATTVGARCRSRRATATPGRTARRTSPSRRSSMAWRSDARSRSATSTACASWPSSAIRSRPTTSRPPGRSRRASPAGQWLQAHGVGPLEFNSYGARRGHHEVMMRGTFANIRLRNALVRGQGGAVHGPPARRRAGLHLRRRDALRGRGRAAGDHRRPRIRLRLVARLGGQGSGAAGRPGGPRRELRADPSLEPGRDGRSCRSSSGPARAPRRSA